MIPIIIIIIIIRFKRHPLNLRDSHSRQLTLTGGKLDP